MIKRYCLTRKEIISLIIKAEKTKDGFYYYPKFNSINTIEGNVVDEYFYPRDMFINKIYFTENDIKLYLSKKEVNDFYENDYIMLNDKFKNIFKGLETLSVKDYVPGYKYSISDIIDIFEFKYYYYLNNK